MYYFNIILFKNIFKFIHEIPFTISYFKYAYFMYAIKETKAKRTTGIHK